MIDPGEGAILDMSYVSTSIYNSQINITFLNGASILSDQTGSEISSNFGSCIVTVNGEEPPPISEIENLTAVAEIHIKELRKRKDFL